MNCVIWMEVPLNVQLYQLCVCKTSFPLARGVQLFFLCRAGVTADGSDSPASTLGIIPITC